MKRKSRLAFNSLCAAIALAYSVDSVAEKFSVTPSQAQTLHDKIQESTAFLQQINMVGVEELTAEKVIGSTSGFIAKRTNTANKDRTPRNLLTLGNKTYQLYKVEYDTCLPYQTMDNWAKFPDLSDRYARYIRHAIALSKIKVGWYGTSVAEDTDSDANPNGEDVNIGWLQLLRLYDGGKQMFDEGATTGEIRVGEGGDFANLDSLVHAVKQMIHEHYREGGDLVAIVGSDFLSEDKAQLFEAQGQTPTEKERIENAQVTRTYGGLRAYTFPNFPARGLVITSFDNLSIYHQESSVRKSIMDNPKRDQIEDYQSLNEGYVIEDEEKMAAIEFANVKFTNDGGTSWA